MKSTVETLEPTKVRLAVEVPFEEMKSEMGKAYKRIAGQVSIPGLRKGHVPPRIIDQRSDHITVIEQVVNQVLLGYYSNTVNENDLRPTAQPAVGVTEIPSVIGPRDDQLVFTAEIDAVPALELPEIDEKLVVEVEPTGVTREDIEKELEDLRGRFATLRTINRKTKADDFATIDLVTTIDGKQVDSVSDVSHEIGSSSMLDGQGTALYGAKTDGEVTFTSELEGGEHEDEEAEVTIITKAMKARELPKADDGFTQMVSEFDTINEFRKDLKKQAARSKESQQAPAACGALIGLLLGKVEVILPGSAVDHQAKHRVGEDAKPEAKKKTREAIERETRTKLLSEALAKRFDMQVSQQELIDYTIQMPRNSGTDTNQLFSSSQQMTNVVADLGCSKALIEALKVVAVKGANGADVDLSKFFGTDPAVEESAEIITEVADEQE